MSSTGRAPGYRSEHLLWRRGQPFRTDCRLEELGGPYWVDDEQHGGKVGDTWDRHLKESLYLLQKVLRGSGL